MATDEELVERLRGGEQDAAHELFERHVADLRARVRARLPGILRRKVGASDVVQEAFAAAFRRIAEFEDRGEGSFGKWVGRILEHKIRDEVRKHLGTEKRAANREAPHGRSSVASPQAPARGPTPSVAAMARETRRDVQRVIEALPESYQEILRLVHRQGVSLRDVAARLDKSEEAVRKTYSRAVSAFTARMNEWRKTHR